MNRIEEIADQLVSGAKESTENIKFIKSYKYSPAETPVRGYLAVVEAANVKQKRRFLGGLFREGLKGEAYTAELWLSVYCPKGLSGAGLSEKTLELANALKNADTAGYIKSIKIEGIAYSENSAAVYRKIRVGLGFVLCGEAV